MFQKQYIMQGDQTSVPLKRRIELRLEGPEVLLRGALHVTILSKSNRNPLKYFDKREALSDLHFRKIMWDSVEHGLTEQEAGSSGGQLGGYHHNLSEK